MGKQSKPTVVEVRDPPRHQLHLGARQSALDVQIGHFPVRQIEHAVEHLLSGRLRRHRIERRRWADCTNGRHPAGATSGTIGAETARRSGTRGRESSRRPSQTAIVGVDRHRPTHHSDDLDVSLARQSTGLEAVNDVPGDRCCPVGDETARLGGRLVEASRHDVPAADADQVDTFFSGHPGARRTDRRPLLVDHRLDRIGTGCGEMIAVVHEATMARGPVTTRARRRSDQQMRGSCSPSGMSTTRDAPSAVRATTMPG